MAKKPLDESPERPAGDRPAECDLLVPFALSACTEEDSLTFEVHILDCDQCFEDLQAIDRTRLLVRRFMESSPVALESAKAVQRRRAQIRALVFATLGAAAFALGFLVARLV